MDQTNLNVMKMLEPKKYKKKTPKTPLNKLFDMKDLFKKKLEPKKKKKMKKRKGYWAWAGVCCKNTTLLSCMFSVNVPSGSKIRTLNESIINGWPLCT
mgnify:CR=1 FL=1